MYLVILTHSKRLTMKKLVILFIGDPKAIHVQRWVRYFVQAGHKVHFIPYPDSFSTLSAELFAGVHIHNAKDSFLRKRMRAWKGLYKKILIVENFVRLKRLLKKKDIDLVHAHYITGCGWIAAFTGFQPFVLTAWGSDVNIDPGRSRIYNFLSRRTISCAHLITANSSDLKEKLIKLGAESSKIHIIQGGLELEKFQFKRGSENLRSKLGLHREQLVLSTRMLGKVYNLDIIIKTVPLVKQSITDVKFVFLYRGERGQEEELKALVENTGVNDSVILKGPVDNDQIAEYYQLADVFVSITSSDGMPGSLTEAMACGAVPVVTDLPYVKEWIRNNVNGIIVPVRDVEATARAIVFLLTHPEKRAEMALLNRELVCKKASHSLWMGKVEKMYRHLVGNKIH